MKSWVVTILSTLASPAARWPRGLPNAKRTWPTSNLLLMQMSFRFQAAQLCATAVQQRCMVFSEGSWTNGNTYNYCLIIVENSDEDVQVTFYLTDAHEMNWVTEFLDAPFFARPETEKLFSLMNTNRAVRGERVGRFRVDFYRWQPRHAQILVFSFVGVQPRRG